MESAKKTGLFRSGAGVIAALVIILLFVLTALYLKSLIRDHRRLFLSAAGKIL